MDSEVTSGKGVREGKRRLRHTLALTGGPIATDEILRDSIPEEGKPLAQQVKAVGPPHLRVEAHGTAPIATLEVLRYSKSAERLN